jgi:hypothetical protein
MTELGPRLGHRAAVFRIRREKGIESDLAENDHHFHLAQEFQFLD